MGDAKKEWQAWWRPAVEPEMDYSKPMEFDPLEVGPLPKKPWKIGEARPTWTLPLSSSQAATYVNLAVMSAWCVEVYSGRLNVMGSVPVALAYGVAIFTLPRPLAVGIESLSSNRWGLAGIKRASKVVATGAAGEIIGYANSFVALPAMAASGLRMFGRGLRGEVMKALGKNEPDLGNRSQAPTALWAFSEKLGEAAKGYRLRSKWLLQEAPDQLTEVGSWRMARDLISDGEFAKAVGVWMAKPFNPEWAVRLQSKENGIKALFNGERMSFQDAIAQAASNARAPEVGSYLADAAFAIRVAAERLQLGESAAPTERRARKAGL